MDEQRQDNQLEHIYDSSVPIQDIALKTSQEQWMIMAARHYDDMKLLPVVEKTRK